MPRVWLSDDERFWCLVSEVDAHFLLQWRWSLHQNQRGKLYVRRRICSSNIYMHRVIMRRVTPPPSEAHCYVDHINNNGLDNRRENLRWATASENAKNLSRDGVSGGLHGLMVRRGVTPCTASEFGQPMDVPGFD